MLDSERWFLHGQLFSQVYLTPKGWLVISADVDVQGTELHLNVFDCKPMHTRYLHAGVAANLAIRRDLLNHAHQEGYNLLVIDGVRTSGRNPNRPVHYTRSTL